MVEQEEHRLKLLAEAGVQVIEKFDASILIDIWLQGLEAGLYLAMHGVVGLPPKKAEHVVDETKALFVNDPATMESVRKMVLDKLQGLKTSPHAIVLPSTSR